MKKWISRQYAAGLAIAAISVAGMAPAAAIAGPLSPTGRWTANAQGNAPVPPMGWSSWNAFNSDIDEQKILGNAKVLVDSGLSRLGYRYVDIDDGWWLKRRQPDGRMVIRTSSFPSARLPGKDNSSFRPLTDRLHAMGLKAGIYSDIGRNSCGQIYTSNFANQPEGTQAEREVGLYGHVAQDISLYFKEWGFDLIKVDGCGIRGLAADTPLVRSGRYRALKPLVDMDSLGRTDIPAVRALYQQVADALARDNPDHDYVYSICLWGSANVREWAKDVGNISRTSDDISPSWSRMLSNLDSVSTRALYAEPGTWNDPDMLYIGSGDFDADHLTEARSHFALWAMMDAPLMIGMDMRKVSPALMAILGNADIVALDQDPAGNQAVPAFMSGDIQTFVKTLNTGEKAVAIFNRSLNPRKVTLTAEQLKYRPDADVVLTDLWSKAKTHFRGQTSFRIKPHQTLIFTAKGTRRLPNGLYLSEQPGMVNPAVDGVTVPTPDPTIHRSVPGWASTTGTGVYPQYGGWGGAQADRAPYGQSLSIAGHAYDTGIGILANSRMEVRNNGFTQFVASVGVDDSALPTDSPVVFEVYGDGKLLAQSQPKHFGEAPDRLKADVRGVSIVELVARATGKSPAPEPIAWANARLIH